MVETTVKIEGMMCSMCEAHIQDAIRKAIPVQKVKASHSRGEAVLLSANPVSEEALHAAIDPTGYRILSVTSAPREKKGFSLFGRK